MAVLIVAIGVITILWTAAMPVWNQLARREKEEELVFRGNQYARAIGLFQRRYANANPPSIDVLIQQRFLRRKYKDPMVPDGEFQLLYQTMQQPGAPQQPGTSQQPGIPQQSGAPAGRQGGPPQPAPSSPVFTSAQQTTGGVIGVASKSKEASLRVYNGRTHYNEWQFIYLATTQQPGVPAGGAGVGPGPGRGVGPGPATPGGPLTPGGRGGRGGPPGAPGPQPPPFGNPGGFPFPSPGMGTPPTQVPPARP
jgi:type II secretory pathway pseudopilin PulG